MRIGLVFPHLEVGGVETQMFRLARYLGECGHDVEMVITERPGAWGERPRSFNISCTSILLRGGSSAYTHAFAVGRHLAERNFDICLLNHARLAQAALSLLPDRTVAIPVIHGDNEWIYTVGCANPDAWNVAVAVGPRVFERTQQILGNKPAVLITNGIEVPNFSREYTAPAAGPLKACFVGRLIHEKKGILLLPTIIHECQQRGVDVELTVVGDGPDRVELQALFRDSGLLGRVQLKGVIPSDDEVIHIFRTSDIFIMPSFTEGLPITLLEAMANGCVPIVSNLPGITSNIVDDGKEGFTVERGDPLAFVAPIDKLHSNREMLQTLGAAARSKVADHYSIQATGSRYLELFDRVMTGGYPLCRRRSEHAVVDKTLFRPKDYHPSIFTRILNAVRRRPAFA